MSPLADRLLPACLVALALGLPLIAGAGTAPQPGQRVTLAGGSLAVRVHGKITVERPGKGPMVVWQGDEPLRGDPGERLGKAARFEDVSGDGTPDIVTGIVYEPVRLCGAAELPLLYRQAYNESTGELQPVEAARPAPFAIRSTLLGRVATTAVEPTLALAESVSSAGLGQDDLMSLVGPFGLSDLDPATRWIPASTRGQGEFATFRLPVGPFGLLRVGVRGCAGFAGPKTLILVLEDRAVRLELPPAVALRPTEWVWFELEAPIQTSCASVIIESAFEPSAKGPLAIADLVLVTEADGRSALPNLARDLADPKRRRAAAALLERRGQDGAAAVIKIFDSYDLKGRTLALRVLAATDPEASMARLVDGALAEDPGLREAGLLGMKKAPAVAAKEIEGRLDPAVPAQAHAALAALSRLPEPLAAQALMTRAGTGDRPFRNALRGALGRAAARSPLAAAPLAKALEEDALNPGGTERTLDLLRAALPVNELRPLVVRITGALAESDASFATQYRLMDVAAALGCEAPPQALLQAAAHRDAAVRAQAVTAAAVCRGPLSQSLSVRAIDDPDVPVRLAGWDAVEAPGELLDRFVREPWPGVRRRLVPHAIPAHPQAAALLSAAVADTSPAVRTAALHALVPHQGPIADALVAGRLSDPREASDVRAAAARAVAARCQVSATDVLFELLRQGAEPLASEAAIEVAVAAAAALGELGTKQARESLEKARRRSHPITDRAIDAALANAPQPCRP